MINSHAFELAKHLGYCTTTVALAKNSELALGNISNCKLCALVGRKKKSTTHNAYFLFVVIFWRFRWSDGTRKFGYTRLKRGPYFFGAVVN